MNGVLAGEVRRQVELGRILCLGAPTEGVWITESAVLGVLRPTADAMSGIAVHTLRLSVQPSSGEPGEPLPRARAASVATEAEPEPHLHLPHPEPDGPPSTAGHPAAGSGQPPRPGPAVLARDDLDIAGHQRQPDGTPGCAPPPPPVSALPPGPLRMQVACEVTAQHPIPVSVTRLTRALAQAAEEGLGLLVTAIDVAVTGLLDPPGQPTETTPCPQGSDRHALAASPDLSPGAFPESAGTVDPGDDLLGRTANHRPPAGPLPGDGGDHRGTLAEQDVGRLAAEAARMALAVPGVAGLDRDLGGALVGGRSWVPGVRLADTADAVGHHVQLCLIVAAGQRVLDVARQVRGDVLTALTARAAQPLTVTVLVTAVQRR